MKEIEINIERLEKRLKMLATFGANNTSGIDRSIGEDSDKRARKYLIGLLKNNLEAEVRVDGIANIWGKIEGEEDLLPLTIGSHHDAVRNGGMYDGALGVLMAIEVAERLKEEKIKLRHPLQVVSFSAEEPNSYNLSTMGSRSITGKLTKGDIEKAVDKEQGKYLKDTLLELGGDIERIEESRLTNESMRSFIECHIEQGRILYDRGLSVAAVNKITGIYREEIEVKGEANHAGTTLMKYRHDSLLGASEACLALEKVIKDINREDVSGTVGKLSVYPNSANIISGDVTFTCDIRTPNKDIKEEIVKKFTKELEKIESIRGIRFNRKVILNQSEVNMDTTVVDTLNYFIKDIQKEKVDIVSMAGHDSVHMSDIAKTGMLFVQSINGKSHCPDEKTDIKDIKVAGDVLIRTIIRLDEVLD